MSVRWLGPADVRALAQRLTVRPTKSLGQNFVHDANTIRRIVRASRVTPDDVVLEIGPGLGSLTLGLLDVGATVVAVEIDPRLAAALPDTVRDRASGAADRLTVVTADALRLPGLSGPSPTALVANLPYNVAVPVLLRVLELMPSLRTGLVLVQAEVADRLTAAPGSRTYGVPTVKVAWYASAEPAGSVPRTVFWPVPNVDSGLVRLVRRDPPPLTNGATRQDVFRIVDLAFGQRRKMLRSALAPELGAASAQVLQDVGIDPRARGETLTIVDYAKIASAVAGRVPAAP